MGVPKKGKALVPGCGFVCPLYTVRGWRAEVFRGTMFCSLRKEDYTPKGSIYRPRVRRQPGSEYIIEETKSCQRWEYIADQYVRWLRDNTENEPSLRERTRVTHVNFFDHVQEGGYDLIYDYTYVYTLRTNFPGSTARPRTDCTDVLAIS